MWCSWSIPERCFDQAPSWGAHGSSVWGTFSETQLDGLWMEKNKICDTLFDGDYWFIMVY
jgi:hypothetical protein